MEKYLSNVTVKELLKLPMDELLKLPIEKIDPEHEFFPTLYTYGVNSVENLVSLTKSDCSFIFDADHRLNLELMLRRLQQLGLSICPVKTKPRDWVATLKSGDRTNIEEIIAVLEKNAYTLNTKIDYNKLRIIKLNDLVKWSKKGLMFIYPENIVDQINDELKTMGIELKPDNIYDDKTWNAMLKNDIRKLTTQEEFEKNIKNKKIEEKNNRQEIEEKEVELVPSAPNKTEQLLVSTKARANELNINEIPEKYRENYALGAMVKAIKDQKNSLIKNIIHQNSRLNEEKSRLPRVRYTKEQTKEISDDTILKAVGKNVPIFKELDNAIEESIKKAIYTIMEDEHLSFDNKMTMVKSLINLNTTTFPSVKDNLV